MWPGWQCHLLDPQFMQIKQRYFRMKNHEVSSLCELLSFPLTQQMSFAWNQMTKLSSRRIRLQRKRKSNVHCCELQITESIASSSIKLRMMSITNFERFYCISFGWIKHSLEKRIHICFMSTSQFRCASKKKKKLFDHIYFALTFFPHNFWVALVLNWNLYDFKRKK